MVSNNVLEYSEEFFRSTHPTHRVVKRLEAASTDEPGQYEVTLLVEDPDGLRETAHLIVWDYDEAIGPNEGLDVVEVDLEPHDEQPTETTTNPVAKALSHIEDIYPSREFVKTVDFTDAGDPGLYKMVLLFEDQSGNREEAHISAWDYDEANNPNEGFEVVDVEFQDVST